MKRFVLCLIAILVLQGCKKEKKTVCETSMPAVAGFYHLAKMEQVAYSTGIATNISATLSSCELQAVYQLKADSSITYTETAPCSNNGNGNWQMSTSSIHIFFNAGNGSRLNQVHSFTWDCSNLAMMTAFPGVIFNYRYTLTKFQ